MNKTVEQIQVDKSTDLSSLLVTAGEIQDTCRDFIVSDTTNKNMYYNSDMNGIQFHSDSGENEILSLTPYALQQLCSKLGIPSRYVEKCIDNGFPELAADNINAWLDEHHRNLFVRSCNNKVRGILSDQYTVLDAPSVLEVVEEVLNPEEYNVKGYLINEERLHLRIVQNTLMKGVGGDDLYAGVLIDSSDVGRSALTAQFFIYKQVCTNGLCITEDSGYLFQQRHVGIDAIEFREGLVSSLKQVSAMASNYSTLIRAAQKEILPGIPNNLLHSKDTSVVKELIEMLRAKTKLSEDSAMKVIDTMNTSYSATKWGLINSLTQVAQDFTLERRIELENIAGSLLIA